MKTQIYEYIKTKKHVSFAELSNHIEGFNGEYMFHLPENANVVLWVEMSEKATESVFELLKEQKIDHMLSKTAMTKVLIAAIKSANVPTLAKLLK